MKKKLLGLGIITFTALALTACGSEEKNTADSTDTTVTVTETETATPTEDAEPEPTPEEYQHYLNSDKGYAGVNDKLPDFSQYENTSAYVKVTTVSELIDALAKAKSTYTTSITNVVNDAGYVVRNNVRKNETNWKNALAKGLYLKNDDGTYTQIPADTAWDANDTVYTASTTYYEDSPYSIVETSQTMEQEGTVHVIEIANDLDLGYKHLSDEDIAKGMVNNFTKASNESIYSMSSMFKENGMSQFLVQNMTNLLIYSKNGAKLTHGGFKVNYSRNIVFRNLDMDEMWQWEDAPKATAKSVGDYDAFGWAYFKIGFSSNIWIDHCSFGKSYDGQIDISNQYWNTTGTYNYSPYGTDGTAGVHISYCRFNGGDDDKDGYLYKMMEEIEKDYQAGGTNYLYYNTLRDNGLSFEQILYGIAIPQKKAFLDGDSGNEYTYNTNIRVSIANCYFKNIEDRLPKVRSGVAYMYNTVIDNYQYYEYRNQIKNTINDNTGISPTVAITKVNSSWKCGMVSQGIVCGLGGSVAAENCIFRGIEDLLKNNDSSTVTNNMQNEEATSAGGYKIINCTYQKAYGTEPTEITNATPSTLTEANFKWRTNNGNAPFTPELVSLDELENHLLNTKYGAGVQSSIGAYLLKTK